MNKLLRGYSPTEIANAAAEIYGELQALDIDNDLTELAFCYLLATQSTEADICNTIDCLAEMAEQSSAEDEAEAEDDDA